MFKFILITTLFCSTLLAEVHFIEYDGIKIGEIFNLSKQIEKNYIKAKVTNKIAKFVLQKDYVVFYKGNKPKIEKNIYYKKSNKVIDILNKIKEKPETGTQNIQNKIIKLNCIKKNCKYEYYSKNKLKSKGSVVISSNKIAYFNDILNKVKIFIK